MPQCPFWQHDVIGNIMIEIGRDLFALFPAQRQALHALQAESERYRGLAVQHHNLGQAIHGIEEELDVASSAWLANLKKQRLILLDEIAKMVGEWRIA